MTAVPAVQVVPNGKSVRPVVTTDRESTVFCAALQMPVKAVADRV
ncbi:hypothetical protein U5A82_17355 [Sphingobium sp. CR2-8]|nr:hypothetical protein [Sphingobium sp. CR2-8]MEC3912176.1 hypothetical protein [Sphingobium sp. CR2-8]